MKYVMILTLLISSSLAWADLENGAVPLKAYHRVNVQEVSSAKVEAIFHPEDSNGLAYYSGKIIFNLVVEGNICGDSAASFGSNWSWTDQGSVLSLFTGIEKANAPDACLEYSKPTTVVVEEKIEIVKFEGTPIKESYLIRTYGDAQVLVVISEDASGLVVSITN